MKKNQDTSADAAELRRRAEERLKSQRPRGQARGQRPTRSGSSTNCRSTRSSWRCRTRSSSRPRDEMEALLEKYTDLYDFAPVGYFTLDRDGAIRQVNLTGARLLGVERSRLVNRRFGAFRCPRPTGPPSTPSWRKSLRARPKNPAK